MDFVFFIYEYAFNHHKYEHEEGGGLASLGSQDCEMAT